LSAEVQNRHIQEKLKIVINGSRNIYEENCFEGDLSKIEINTISDSDFLEDDCIENIIYSYEQVHEIISQWITSKQKNDLIYKKAAIRALKKINSNVSKMVKTDKNNFMNRDRDNLKSYL
jgi:hypothetical protein